MKREFGCAAKIAALLVALLTCGSSASAIFAADPAQPPRWPGLQPDGQMLLFNQWSLRPAGKQIPLGIFPVNMAMHPSKPFAAVLHCGFGEHEIVIVDLTKQAVASRVKLPEAFYGITFGPDGTQLFASGSQFEVVHQFSFADGKLADHRELRIADVKQTEVPAGLVCTPDGRSLLVACAWGHSLMRLPLADPRRSERLPLAKDSYPYALLPSRDGGRLYVSLWGAGAVAVVDLKAWKVIATWQTRLPALEPATSHPTEMALSPDEKLLYVACSNGNVVTVFDTATGQPLEQISTALYPNSPGGSTPNSLSLSADGRVLLVANADNNNVAMFDVSRSGNARSLGFIPTGWYPTSVRFGRQDAHATEPNEPAGDHKQIGETIYILNGKGIESHPNPQGPNPLDPKKKDRSQYIGNMLLGTLSVIAPPSPFQMAEYSRQARAASPLRADQSPAGPPPAADSPIPSRLGGSSPIKHCIYVIMENRTYDQVFGDVKEGNGDARLCIFGRHVTPNRHVLARQFVLLDNFYANSEVSADGHEWLTAAYASDFVQKTWPINYRGRGPGQKVGYPSEGGEPIAFPAAGYIWDRCREAGVSYRSYGEFIANGPKPGLPSHASVKALEGHFDPLFRGWDLGYPDAKRTDRFLEELHGFEKSGSLPQFIVLRLPNDHTRGTDPGAWTPTAMVAENDLALGRLIEGVSHSRFWPNTALFIVEDDAQNGSDHVDAHRTVALVVSPYCRRHAVDSTLYSTVSMLRTMELILGLKPMSQFDAAAAPMHGSFQPRPDAAPFAHLPAEVNVNAINLPGVFGAAESRRMDFSREDAADESLLNQVIWRSVRGPDSPMPPPVHAAFVRTPTRPADGDGDDD